jgi:hypothetical protein
VGGIGDAEVAPDLGGIVIEGQNVFGEFGEDGGEPGFQKVGLGGVGAVADEGGAALAFTVGDGGKIELPAGCLGAGMDARLRASIMLRIGMGPLAARFMRCGAAIRWKCWR